jgi:hypothetical protein
MSEDRGPGVRAVHRSPYRTASTVPWVRATLKAGQTPGSAFFESKRPSKIPQSFSREGFHIHIRRMRYFIFSFDENGKNRRILKNGIVFERERNGRGRNLGLTGWLH